MLLYSNLVGVLNCLAGIIVPLQCLIPSHAANQILSLLAYSHTPSLVGVHSGAMVIASTSPSSLAFIYLRTPEDIWGGCTAGCSLTSCSGYKSSLPPSPSIPVPSKTSANSSRCLLQIMQPCTYSSLCSRWALFARYNDGHIFVYKGNRLIALFHFPFFGPFIFTKTFNLLFKLLYKQCREKLHFASASTWNRISLTLP